MAQDYMQMATSHGACGDGVSAGTAAAVTINCGFKPKYVKVIVIDTACSVTEWIQGMTADKGVRLTGVATHAELASTGITVGPRGFILGAGAQTASKAYHWIALG